MSLSLLSFLPYASSTSIRLSSTFRVLSYIPSFHLELPSCLFALLNYSTTFNSCRAAPDRVSHRDYIATTSDSSHILLQIAMFNSAFSEAGCTGIIEQWCSSPQSYEFCCGLCPYVRFDTFTLF